MKLYVVEIISDEMVIPVGVSLDKAQATIAREKFQDMTDITGLVKGKYHVSDYEIGRDCYTDLVTKEQIKFF